VYWFIAAKKQYENTAELFGLILCYANLFPMLCVWAGIGIRLDGTVMHNKL